MSAFKKHWQWSAPLLAAAAIMLAACASSPSAPQAAPQALTVQSPATACAALSGKTIAASRLNLPTSGAVIDSAQFTDGAYCKVIASVKPVDPAAPFVRVQLNLPNTWNNKSLQCGGGGLNGNLIACSGPMRDAPPGPSPLQRGYATVGTDGGHQNSPDKDLQSFALNDEALRNHAYGAYKKAFDTAQAIIGDYYGRKTSLSYFFGGSEGGREGLIAAQRYPQDYDGIVSVVPLVSWTGTQFGGYTQYLATQGDGWMNAAKVALVSKAALQSCDLNDGLADGMIANYRKCNASAALRALRCASGRDEGDACLSDAQLRVIETVRSPISYGFTLANGETEYPPYATGAESMPGNMIPTIMPAAKPAPDDLGKANYATGDIRYFFARDPAFRGPIDWKKYEGRIREISTLMDANNPDLSAFRRHGGKLIIKSNTADYLVSPQLTWRYYDRVIATMGANAAHDFSRLYVSPWTSHNGAGRAGDGAPTPDKVDLLAVLENWVEHGQAPASTLTLTSYASADAGAAPIASWPMCSYPAYPHYNGAGDVKAAASYSCRTN